MALPFVLTAFGLGLSFWQAGEGLHFETWKRNRLLLLLSSVLLGGLAFLNTWDLPTFGFLIALLVLVRNLMVSRDARQALGDTAGFMAPLAVLSVVLYIPFYVSFSSQAGFVDAVRDGATRPMQAFLFWGAIMAVALPLPLYWLYRDAEARTRSRLLRATAVPLTLLVLWVLLIAARHGAGEVPDAITARGWNWLTALFFAGSLVASILALSSVVRQRAESSTLLVPVLAAMTTAFLLIYGAEFFYVTDVFSSRLNTVFKFYYQAWLLLGVSGAVGGWWLFGELTAEKKPSLQMLRGAWSGVAVLLVAGALLYPLSATLSRTDGLSRANRTLNGLQYVYNTPSSIEMGLVLWLRNNADPGDRLVEAVGGQYSAAGRISAWTGVPTVLGWPGHEQQWGRDPDVISQRKAAVDAVYETGSLEEALSILQQYGVTYVVVGTVERATYPPEGLAKFQSLQAVANAGTATLYRVPPMSISPDTDSTGAAP